MDLEFYFFYGEHLLTARGYGSFSGRISVMCCIILNPVFLCHAATLYEVGNRFIDSDDDDYDPCSNTF